MSLNRSAVLENEKKVLTMTEYIEREAAIEATKHAWAKGIDPVQYMEIIPAADVAPVRHGRWLCVDTDTEQFFLCNRCKKKEYWESNYCQNCGCRMDGGADE